MAFIQLRGTPSLPPNSAPEKLFYLITLAGLIGVAVDLLGAPPLIERLAFVLFPGICLVWFSLRLLARPDIGLVIKLALIWAGAAIVLWQICAATARGGALAGTIPILVTAVSAAGVAALAPFIGMTLPRGKTMHLARLTTVIGIAVASVVGGTARADLGYSHVVGWFTAVSGELTFDPADALQRARST
jgi:hypothetical protein